MDYLEWFFAVGIIIWLIIKALKSDSDENKVKHKPQYDKIVNQSNCIHDRVLVNMDIEYYYTQCNKCNKKEKMSAYQYSELKSRCMIRELNIYKGDKQ